MPAPPDDRDAKNRPLEVASSGRPIEVVDLDDAAAVLESTGKHAAAEGSSAPVVVIPAPPPMPGARARRSVPPPPPGGGAPRTRASVPPPPAATHDAGRGKPSGTMNAPASAYRASIPPPPPPAPATANSPTLAPSAASAATNVMMPPPSAGIIRTAPVPSRPSVTMPGIPPVPPKVASRPNIPAMRPPPTDRSPPSTAGSRPQPLAANATMIAGTPSALTPSHTPSDPGRDEIPWYALHERLPREAEALATAQPTGAALLFVAQARAALDVRGESATADAALARAVLLAPDTRAVAHLRRWMAERRGKVADVLPCARAELPLVGDPRDRNALLHEIASIEEHATGQADAAERTLREAVALDPRDAGAWDDLGALQLRKRNWKDAAASWESLAGIVDDARVRAALLTAVASVREVHLDDAAGALLAAQKAVEADGGNVTAASVLEPMLLRAKRWTDYARTLVTEGDQVGDPSTARECYERAGDVLWECARDGASAAACYERAAVIAPREIGPLEKFAAVLEGSGRYADLPRVYERMLQVLRDPVQQAAVLLKLGGVFESRLDRPDDALRAYQRALEASPTFSPAAHVLVAAYRRAGKHRERIALETEEADRVTHATQRSARYAAVAESCEASLHDTDQAVTLYERALSLDPANTTAFDALDRIHRARGQWEALATLYEQALTNARDAHRVRGLRTHLAALYHDRLGQAERGAQLYQQALTGEPDAFATWMALARATADAEQWAQHVAVLEQEAKLVHDDDERVRVLDRIASVSETRLNDPVRALATWMTVLEKAPQYEPALLGVARLHQAQSRWGDLVAAERRRLTWITRPDDAATVLYGIGRVCEERLGRPDDAARAYEEALERTPTFAPALVALERLLRAGSRWAALGDVFERQAAAAQDPGFQARAWCQAAAVYELHLDDATRALTTYEKALVAVPGLDTALWGVARIREARGEWAALDAAWQTLLKKTTHSVARLRLLIRTGRLCEFRLNAPGRAGAAYEEALSSGPLGASLMVDRLRVARVEGGRASVLGWLEHIASATTDPMLALGLLRARALELEFTAASVEEVLSALTATLAVDANDPASLDGLARTLARGAPDARLPATLEARAHTVHEGPTRAVLMFAAGALFEAAGDRAHADAAYQSALEAHADFLPAIAGGRRLREAAGDPAGMARWALHAARVSVHPQNAADARMEAADLQSDPLGESHEALASYRAVLSQQPTHARAFTRAMQLLEAAGDWRGATDVLAQHAEAVPDDPTRAKLLAARGSILAERLGDTRGAIADLERALVLRTEEPALLGLLARLHEREQHWPEAAQLYERLSKAAGEGALRREAGLAQARLWTVHVRDYERARAILEDLHRADGADRAVTTRLAEVHALLGEHGRSREMYQVLSQSGSGPERARALLALGEVTRIGLGDLVSAHAAAGAAFLIAMQDPAALAVIDEHYGRTEDWSAYGALGDEAVAHAPAGAPGAVPLRMALARVYREKLHTHERAESHLRAAIEAAPQATEPRLALAVSLLGSNDHAAVLELRRVIDLDPSLPAAYRGLLAVCQRMGLGGAACLMASTVALLGEGGAAVDSALTLAVSPHPVPNALGADEALQTLVGPTRARFVRRALALMEPHLHEIFPAGQEALASFTRVPDSFPAVIAARGIAASLGAGSLGFYRSHGRDTTALLSEPRALAFGPEALTDGGVSRAVFDSAWFLARITGGSLIGQLIPPEQVRAFLEVATDSSADGPGYKDLRKRVSSILPRRVRKELERLVEESPGNVARELPYWDDEERKRALRLAVIYTRDVRVVAHAIAPEVTALPDLEGRRRALAAHAMLVDAVRFAASEACWAAHRRAFGQP